MVLPARRGQARNGIPVRLAPDVRLTRVVARAALIATLASVVVPGLAGSRVPSAPGSIDPSAFRRVDLDQPLTAMALPATDPAILSDGRLDADSVLREPQPEADVAARPAPSLHPPNVISRSTWRYDPEISWYGPGFYGNNGACGMIPGGLTPETVGVAHRSLPCGTRVTFRNGSHVLVTYVIDRGPYVRGRIFDLTKGACVRLDHCYTGPIYYRIG
jgi:hypothetical protein